MLVATRSNRLPIATSSPRVQDEPTSPSARSRSPSPWSRLVYSLKPVANSGRRARSRLAKLKDGCSGSAVSGSRSWAWSSSLTRADS